VQAVIDELDYRPNTLARGLVSGKSQSVVIVIGLITDPFFPQVVLGAESVAQQAGYSVILCNAGGEPERAMRYVDILEDKHVDGMIICGSFLVEEQLNQIAARQCLSVLTSYRPKGAAVVGVNEEEAVMDLVTHLIDLGHTQIGHISASPKLNHPWRLNGYKSALSKRGIRVPDAWVCDAEGITVEEGKEAARQLLQQAPELTAIACFNDLIAAGTLQACAEQGLCVPEDVAVTGFDDIDLASLIHPRLTTVHMPRYELGEALMTGLLRRIHEGCEGDDVTLFELEMVIRESCGAELEG
jgi:DNA-binding LacI/PurR family transcriptional regulator